MYLFIMNEKKSLYKQSMQKIINNNGEINATIINALKIKLNKNEGILNKKISF